MHSVRDALGFAAGSRQQHGLIVLTTPGRTRGDIRDELVRTVVRSENAAFVLFHRIEKKLAGQGFVPVEDEAGFVTWSRIRADGMREKIIEGKVWLEPSH